MNAQKGLKQLCNVPLQEDQHMERYPENPGEVLYKNNLLGKVRFFSTL